ncbi:hypothetical protein CEXT_736821 [Caerostris extrusa]|uniref:Uncharacterized protein n=1 Tax=Caerostris extrusa TaxID=172846 RepID=A0AAV4XX86_CAEEX|nr:hypothetical protein CEXT_736821 [Caerostris extrusa]
MIKYLGIASCNRTAYSFIRASDIKVGGSWETCLKPARTVRGCEEIPKEKLCLMEHQGKSEISGRGKQHTEMPGRYGGQHMEGHGTREGLDDIKEI